MTAETIPALLAGFAGDRRAVVTADEAVTYGELDDRSRAGAARLVASGVAKGDRVGLLAPNGIAWATTALAVLRIGAVLVPLSTLLRLPELLAQLTAASVTHLVTVPAFRDRRYLDDLDAAAPGLAAALAAGSRHPAVPALRRLWRLDDPPTTGPDREPAAGDDRPANVDPPRPPVESAAGEATPRTVDPPPRPAEPTTGEDRPANVDPPRRPVESVTELPDDMASEGLVRSMEDRVGPGDDLAVLFTSGSRGAPKGTIHTHGGALRSVAAGLEARCVGPGERLYIPMPFFWTGGFSGGLLTALVAGATLLTEAEPDPARTLALLERERATLFRGWPDQAARLAAHPAFARADLSSLRDGSLPAVLPPDRRPAPGARPNLFGMTETIGPWCGDRLDVDLPPGKHGSCGRPFAGWEVRVADPVTGRPQKAGEDGELWLRGPNLLRGIAGRRREQVFTPDGFYRTGDLGRQDEDGYVWFSGRLDDMVKVKGATVYPSEVEVALRSVDGVGQAHVTDVDGAVAALVITDREADVGPAEVVAAVRQRLSAFKVPSRWRFTTDTRVVPLTATAKVDKAALQDLLRESGSEWKALLS